MNKWILYIQYIHQFNRIQISTFCKSFSTSLQFLLLQVIRLFLPSDYFKKSVTKFIFLYFLNLYIIIFCRFILNISGFSTTYFSNSFSLYFFVNFQFRQRSQRSSESSSADNTIVKLPLILNLLNFVKLFGYYDVYQTHRVHIYPFLHYNIIFCATPVYRVRPSYCCFLSCGTCKPEQT